MDQERTVCLPHRHDSAEFQCLHGAGSAQMLLEREAYFSEKFSFHASRVRMTRVDAESLRTMNLQAERAALELSEAPSSGAAHTKDYW